jgi:capsid protein
MYQMFFFSSKAVVAIYLAPNWQVSPLRLIFGCRPVRARFSQHNHRAQGSDRALAAASYTLGNSRDARAE